MTDPHQLLKQVFGFDHFRGVQEEVIGRVLTGERTLAIMPTGAGKSLCYQLPALALEGTALVISPLIALMQDQIRSVIEASRLAPGTRLPPERELALQLGVSRPSLREALIALEIEGIVETRMGSGVYVCAAPSAAAALESPMLGESPSELMQARSVGTPSRRPRPRQS